MQSLLEREILDHLRWYLVGDLSLNAFREWFLGATWDIDGTDDFGAQQASYEIEHRLAEFSNGNWTQDELKSLLRPLLQRTVVSTSNSNSPIQRMATVNLNPTTTFRELVQV